MPEKSDRKKTDEEIVRYVINNLMGRGNIPDPNQQRVAAAEFQVKLDEDERYCKALCAFVLSEKFAGKTIFNQTMNAYTNMEEVPEKYMGNSREFYHRLSLKFIKEKENKKDITKAYA